MQYTSKISWKHQSNTPFQAKTYDRTHDIYFGSSSHIAATSAPEFLGNPKLPNPEELFTASISSCFMLTFLYLAAMKGLMVEEYTAEAIGKLAKNSEGKMAMTEVVIKPSITFQDNKNPDAALLEELFKKSHEQCFISSSVKTNITIQAS